MNVALIETSKLTSSDVNADAHKFLAFLGIGYLRHRSLSPTTSVGDP
jgi:hypothetical protein